MKQPVAIQIDADCLKGELILPENAVGLVLFAHGSGSSRHSPRNQYVAHVIREHRVGTLLFDLLTSSEEAEDHRTAALRFDIPFLGERLVTATNWILKQPSFQHLPLGYFGSSTGGAAALVAAANLGNTIRAVVSRGGRPDLAASALPQVLSPTLLIVGEADHQVLALNKAALARLRCTKELSIVPGATHLFEEAGTLQTVAHAAAEWFANYLITNPSDGSTVGSIPRLH